MTLAPALAVTLAVSRSNGMKECVKAADFACSPQWEIRMLSTAWRAPVSYSVPTASRAKRLSSAQNNYNTHLGVQNNYGMDFSTPAYGKPSMEQHSHAVLGGLFSLADVTQA